MNGLVLVLTFSTVMALASFLAGLLPLSVGLAQKHTRVISAIGTGLLVGSCLIIIIPEGIETLYSAAEHHSQQIFKRQESVEEGSPLASDRTGSASDRPPDAHGYIGLALILGFILMYSIDQIPKHATATFAGRSKPLQISLANLSQGPHRAASPSRTNEESEEGAEAAAMAQSSATTIGLVIHAAADGIALAASSFTARSSTGFIVFLAIMVHKAPAAFGLTSVLLKNGFTKRAARAHLIVFSLAAPVGALATWLLVMILGSGRVGEDEGTRFFTGLLLLFSGGTFLYVAMHTIQESETQPHDHVSTNNGYADGNAYTSSTRRRPEVKQTGLQDTLLCIVGMLLPLLATAGHAH